jgi:Bacterial protein of unknown function (DUF839)
LQALQVLINGSPVTFVPVDATHPDGDTISANQLALHTVGKSWPIKWITIHDTAVQGTVPFDAHAATQAAGATPFKRSEQARFEPDSKFQTFFFVTSGDTDNQAGSQPALAARGAWGGIFRVDLDKTRVGGTITLAVLGDANHAGFSSMTFGGKKDTLLVAEERGDLLHDQLNKLDSIFAYNLKKIRKRTPSFGLWRSGRNASCLSPHRKITNQPGCTCPKATPRSKGCSARSN